MPKDHQKAEGFFEHATENAKTPEEMNQAVYYRSIGRKFKLSQEMYSENRIKLSNTERVKMEQTLYEI